MELDFVLKGFPYVCEISIHSPPPLLLLTSYDAMRCNFVDEEIEQYVEKVKDLAVKVS